MATLSNKTYPKRSNRSQVNYDYEYFDYDSCAEGMSSDEEEEIDNVFLNGLFILLVKFAQNRQNK